MSKKRRTLRERAELNVERWPDVKREDSFALRELLTEAWLAGYRAGRKDGRDKAMKDCGWGK